MNYYNPTKYLNYLRQSLGNNKRHIGFLLSAGCPLSIRTGDDKKPLIPDIAGLTNNICERLNEDRLDKYCEVCYAICHSTGAPPNIEKILSHVRGLKQIIYGGSFNGLSKEVLESLEKKICDAIIEEVSKELPCNDSPYHKLALWIGSIERDYPINLFTTNYDFLMEQALEDCRVAFFDGFIGTKKAFFDINEIEADSLPAKWVRLWKLHGSINWHYDKDNNYIWRGISNTGVSLIHPSHLKYDQSRRMPYLAMMDRLKCFLKEKGSVLVISGYSFNDEHINEVIIQGLQNNPLAIAFGLLHGNLVKYFNAIQLAKERSNLTLLARDGAIIGRQEGIWKLDSTDGLKGNITETIKISTNEGNIDSVELEIGDFAKLTYFLEDMLTESIFTEHNLNLVNEENDISGGETLA